jgi:putative transposase
MQEKQRPLGDHQIGQAEQAEQLHSVLGQPPVADLLVGFPVLLTAARLSRSTFYYQVKVLETGDKHAGLYSLI